MTTEAFVTTLVGVSLTCIMGIIGHLLKSLISEFRETHKVHNKQILDILERLVRLEERTLQASADNRLTKLQDRYRRHD